MLEFLCAILDVFDAPQGSTFGERVRRAATRILALGLIFGAVVPVVLTVLEIASPDRTGTRWTWVFPLTIIAAAMVLAGMKLLDAADRRVRRKSHS